MIDYVPIKTGVQLYLPKCKRYSSCNVPICPLDPEWLDRKTIKGESLCFHLKEAVKPNAEIRFAVRRESIIFVAISEVLRSLQCAYRRLKRALERASTTPFRWKEIEDE